MQIKSLAAFFLIWNILTSKQGILVFVLWINYRRSSGSVIFKQFKARSCAWQAEFVCGFSCLETKTIYVYTG